MYKRQDKDIRDFIFVAFSESIRLVSNRRNGEFKLFRMPPAKVEKFVPDVIKEFSTILQRNIEKMNSFVEACSDTGTDSKVTIFQNDAAVLQDVPNESVDLVITSPPYGDSRTTVAYGEYSSCLLYTSCKYSKSRAKRWYKRRRTRREAGSRKRRG